MGVLAAEPVSIARTGADYPALVDPREFRLYFDAGADVRVGDVAGFRGYTRRIAVLPELWNGAGLVAAYEEAPTYLPDLGQLLRPTGGPPVLDEDTGEMVPPDPDEVGSPVACRVEPTESDGTTPFVGQQAIGKVPFVITVPLTVTNVAPGDLFRVTTSRDARLLTRTLVITGVRASSTATDRELIGFDPQD